MKLGAIDSFYSFQAWADRWPKQTGLGNALNSYLLAPVIIANSWPSLVSHGGSPIFDCEYFRQLEVYERVAVNFWKIIKIPDLVASLNIFRGAAQTLDLCKVGLSSVHCTNMLYTSGRGRGLGSINHP